MSNITIVIPALNEKERLTETLPLYCEYFADRAIILLVDNGSTDGTNELVSSLRKKYVNLESLEFDKPLGKGGAVYAGFDHAQTDLVGFVDADPSTYPEEFEKLIDVMNTGEVDIVIASRWAKGGVMNPPQPMNRRVNGRVFNLFVNVMFGLKVSDSQCGAKLMKRETYKSFRDELILKGFSFDVELLWRAKTKGFVIKEIPINWRFVLGHTFKPYRSGFKVVKELIGLRFSH